ncbi:MAG: alanyl-tRNA editing protein AlaXM [Infirmifilum sp.]|jgi:misacylated tRNA(Ala) deacylase|uniref:Alanyl-tRNA editing protein AlaX n=1 Tax=Infirmifilum uzonense TaxID=1550241 RepID=A0A0F7FHD2_9CREN|nr:alanyl-tRNA editing protein AlaXM [Infirmifilum uzonense]AKG38699.1 alanyl-tRNA editing protein AlaX [Infirmifilum uzonense]
MTKLLYQIDSYLREFEATITRVEGEKVYLDQTAFHPGPSGGLDTDTGWLILPDGTKLEVIRAVEEPNDVAHILSSPTVLTTGTKVKGIINWDRRYRMMRLHTASHVLAAILYKKYGALVTGGHIQPEGARDDFDLTGVDDWKAALSEAISETNKILKSCLEVKVYWLKRDEALKIPGIVKLAGRLPPEVEEIRIVEIPGVDIQADGGPHVKNTCEVGEIVLQKTESKGAKRKRIYYTLTP